MGTGDLSASAHRVCGAGGDHIEVGTLVKYIRRAGACVCVCIKMKKIMPVRESARTSLLLTRPGRGPHCATLCYVLMIHLPARLVVEAQPAPMLLTLPMLVPSPPPAATPPPPLLHDLLLAVPSWAPPQAPAVAPP